MPTIKECFQKEPHTYEGKFAATELVDAQYWYEISGIVLRHYLDAKGVVRKDKYDFSEKAESKQKNLEFLKTFKIAEVKK